MTSWRASSGEMQPEVMVNVFQSLLLHHLLRWHLLGGPALAVSNVVWEFFSLVFFVGKCLCLETRSLSRNILVLLPLLLGKSSQVQNGISGQNLIQRAFSEDLGASSLVTVEDPDVNPCYSQFNPWTWTWAFHLSSSRHGYSGVSLGFYVKTYMESSQVNPTVEWENFWNHKNVHTMGKPFPAQLPLWALFYPLPCLEGPD